MKVSEEGGWVGVDRWLRGYEGSYLDDFKSGDIKGWSINHGRV